MVAATDNVIDEMVQAIVREVQPEQVILFGSRARSDASVWSDVDLLVVERDPFHAGRSRRKEMTRLYRTLAKWVVPHDVLLYSQDEVQRWRDSKNHVIARALRDGRLLYERA